jgi:hypothetical protein
MVFLPNLGVNRRDRLGGIPVVASAQSLDLLDLGQKSSFLNWKRRQVPIFKKTLNGWALSIKLTVMGQRTNSRLREPFISVGRVPISTSVTQSAIIKMTAAGPS